MNDTQNLGNLIKQQRIRIGITLQALAAKSGVSPTHLYPVGVENKVNYATNASGVHVSLGHGHLPVQLMETNTL